MSEEAKAVAPRMSPPSRLGDRLFSGLTLVMAFTVFVLIFLVGWQLWTGSTPAVQKYGLGFSDRLGLEPGPDELAFGALPFIYGTLVSSLLGAVDRGAAQRRHGDLPDGTGAALAAAADHLAHRNAGGHPERDPGALGHLRDGAVDADLSLPDAARLRSAGRRFLPGPIYGLSLLAGGIDHRHHDHPDHHLRLARNSLLRARLQREAAYALGATRWEVTRIAVLSYAKRGIFGAVILGLGRALGETMAVTMVIGNKPQIVASLLAARLLAGQRHRQ